MDKLEEIRTTLCLAAISYRGFHYTTSGHFHEQRLRDAIQTALLETRFPLIQGQWELVWGPQSYRSKLSKFDDSMMFAVRHQEDRKRVVVVIRGTNPISLFDWIVGDFMISKMIPWGDHAPGAEISLSTAFGLSLLLDMESDPNAAGGGTLAKVAAGIARLDDAIRGAIRLDEWRKKLNDLLTGGGAAEGPTLPELAEALGTSKWSSEVENAIQDLVDHLIKASNYFNDAADLGPDFGVLDVLGQHVQLVRPEPSEHSVLAYLRGLDEELGGGLDVVVTGHSKGGALAPALALWLEEAKADGVRTPRGWSSNGSSAVRCISYAGPTPGNTEFAEHCADTLRGKHIRVVNQRDIVPQAWEPATLAKVPSIYDRIPCPAALEAVLQAMVDEASARGYAHEKPSRPRVDLHESTPRDLFRTHTFVGQVIRQHLDGYLEALALNDGARPLTTIDFFDPTG